MESFRWSIVALGSLYCRLRDVFREGHRVHGETRAVFKVGLYVTVAYTLVKVQYLSILVHRGWGRGSRIFHFNLCVFKDRLLTNL